MNFIRAADREIAQAIGWYLERSETAADEFIRAFDNAFEQIATYPDRAALYMHGRRAVRIGQFPYLVVIGGMELA